jgi:hypothetical protein
VIRWGCSFFRADDDSVCHWINIKRWPPGRLAAAGILRPGSARPRRCGRF